MYPLFSRLVMLTSGLVVMVSCNPPARMDSWQHLPHWPVNTPPASTPQPPPRTIHMPVKQTVPCSQCYGSGVEAAVDMSSPIPGTKPCSRCNGQGFFSVY